MNPRLNRLEIQGFRSFGQISQGFDLSDTVSVFWGGNSQGKTSLAEAIEFLFSGQIVRRELMASTKDEFAEALRNAHVGPKCPCLVEADVLCADGAVRKLRRTLIEDYRRGSAAGCSSELTIDGRAALQVDIESVLGIRLSHAPLVAPVLTQHTLAYIFSAPPNERAAYFRALLDTQDLEDFRLAVSKLGDAIAAPTNELLNLVGEAEKIVSIRPTLGQLRKANDVAGVQKQLRLALSTMLTASRIAGTGDLAQDATSLDNELQRRRSRAFPLQLFQRGNPVSLTQLAANDIRKIDVFIAERAKVDVETKRLAALFKAALEVHDHPEGEAADCPLCGTENALSPARIAHIRSQVAAITDYSAAASEFEAALKGVQAQARYSLAAAREALPEFLRMTAAARAKAGFGTNRIRDLVKNDPLVDAWVGELRRRVRMVRALSRRYADIQDICGAALGAPDAWAAKNDLIAAADAVVAQQDEIAAQLPTYLAAARGMAEPLRVAVDQSSSTDGWEALITCARSPDAVFAAIGAANTHALILKGIQLAHQEIDRGNGKVADLKFGDLSDEVRAWWDRLRPGEPTFFEAVRRRSDRARRTVDLRVGLAAKIVRSASIRASWVRTAASLRKL